MAQTETGQITGTVADPSGAVIAGATITATEKSTNTVRTTTSGSAGSYVIPNLTPGNYEISATSAGFQTFRQAVVVTVGARVGADIRLDVGSAATIVEVAERGSQVNTESQTLSSVVSSKEVLELPTITRNPYDLVATAGNVSDADASGRGTGYAINGIRSSGTNVLLDGVANNNEFTGSVGQPVPLDSVQEFSILTNNYTAEYGRASGGVVNVTTKQGSNAFHGTGYEFNRLSALAANSFDNNANGTPKPVFTRNQFGYSVGGPAIKNKLFFFENTEWIRVRSTGIVSAVVPTQQLINASAPNTQDFFKQFGQLSSTVTPLQTFLRGDVCKSGACLAIPASTPIYQKINYGVPSDSGGGSPQNTYELVGRVDYNLSDKTQSYFRYARFKANFALGTQTNSPYEGYNTADFQTDDAYALSITHTFSPSLVSQSKLSFNRIKDIQPLGTQPVAPTLYTTLNSTQQIGNSSIVYPGYSPFTPGNAVPFGGPQNFATLSQDLSYIAGQHNIRFGGSFTYFQDNRTFGAYAEAVEALGTNVTSAVNGLVTGQLHDFQAAVYPQGKFPCAGGTSKATPSCTLTLPVGPPNFSRSNIFHEGSFYGQDTWKATPRFTLNLGIRWDYFGPQANKNPQLDSNFYLGPGSNIETQSGTGSVQVAPNSPVGGLWVKRYGNFAPRMGFAWDVFGNQKTSLRGGYGIGYERNFNNVTFNVIQNPPNYAVLALTAGTDIPQIPITSNNAGPLAGNSGTKALGAVSVRAVDPNIKTSFAHLYSLSLEHQLSNDALVALEYSGSRGENLYTIDRLNMGGSARVYGGFGTASQRINNQYGLINFRTNGGDSLYNAMNARFEVRNLRRYGLTLRANYTWAHSIDDGSSTFSTDATGQNNLGLLDPLHPSLDRGDSDFDIRHRFVVSAVFESPFFKKPGVTNLIAGGWSVTPIFTARTGSPFSVQDCTNEGSALCPRVMFDTPFHAKYTDTQTANPNEFNYLNLGTPDSSYANPLTGTSDFGPFPPTMTGRNVFRTPGTIKFNLGVYKTFSLTERFKLQFRAEAYNVANHQNLYIVYNNTEVSSFTGAPIVTATRGQRLDSNTIGSSVENGRLENRNVQLALKLIF